MTRRSALLVGSRLAQAAPVLALATIVIFGLLQLVPGDPAAVIAGEYATAQRIAEIRGLLGLDRPWWQQYFGWLWGALHGDFGTSLVTGEGVGTEVLRRLPNTLLLVLAALSLSIAVGIPLGLAAATRAGSRIDRVLTGIASLGVAVPNFWLGMILVGTFALVLGWFPATGAIPFTADPGSALRHAALPAVALAAGGTAEISRQLRGAMIDVLSSQYVRTLHAKGLSWPRILWVHGLRNVSLTLLTSVGLVFNRMLGATVAVEAVFAIPGTGSLIVTAATNKDFPMVQGVVFAFAVIVIGCNLVIDLLYAALDPRVTRR
jgi:peptide/nickel transport system permease protein